MSNKIQSLTPEQKAKFPEWVEKYVKHGLSCERADYEKTEKAVREVYKIAVGSEPQLVLYAGSPESACYLGVAGVRLLSFILDNHNAGDKKALLKAGLIVPNEETKKSKLSKAVDDVKNVILGEVGKKGKHINLDTVTWAKHIRNALKVLQKECVRNPSDAIIKQVSPYVLGLDADNDATINALTASVLKTVSREDVQVSSNNLWFGSFWSAWCSYTTFFRDVLKLDPAIFRDFAHLEVIMENCGYVWWNQHVAVISDRPLYIKRNDANRLHCPDGPAIEYPDGFSVYVWNSIRVNRSVIMEPLSIDLIESEKNQEVRRVMIEKFGYAAYTADAPVIDEEKGIGKLRKKSIGGGQELAVVEVINGSKEPDGTYKTYFLSVPPTSKTAAEAVAWTYGLTADEYRKRLVVRT